MKKDFVLCFSGLGRSINYTFENIQRNLIDDLEPKQIFLVTEDQKYLNELIKLFSIYPNLTYKIVKKINKVDESLTFDKRWGPKHNKLNYLNFLYKRFELSKLIKKNIELSDAEKFTYVYSRLDVAYKFPLSPQIKNINIKKKVYLPNFHHWLGGYNDRFAIANFKNFLTYLEIYKHLKKYNTTVDLHSEIITRHHFKQKKLKLGVIRFPFSRVRENGELYDNFDEFSGRLMYPLHAYKHIYKESTLDSLKLIFNKK